MSVYDELWAVLEPHGLIPRGGFALSPEDLLLTGRQHSGGTLVLIGNVGHAMWSVFAPHNKPQNEGTGVSLDEWTEHVLSPIAKALGAEVIFPWSQPYRPFQQWAMRAEPVWPSPIGILIHSEHGLWHAYRAALIFPGAIEIPARANASSPCSRCVEKPCLSACPVGAFSTDGYDVTACARHIDQPPDKQKCRANGCIARAACPVGSPYKADQIQFHMAAFYASRPAI